MSDDRTCPDCGKPLGADYLDGLCPECMLRVGAATGSVPTVELSDAHLEEARGQGTPPAFLPEGSLFGPYRIRRRIGHGGMGVVYEAEEVESGRRVALKVIREKMDAPQDRARFLREGRLAASINHPNCVYVFGTEEIEGIPAIAMEHIPGGTLERRLRHEGPQPIVRTIDAVLQVIAGLEAAQSRGILHRDIKPSNCFEDESGTVKIGDFGLSISTAPRAETLVTETGSMVGTPAFCPPEQLRGEELSGRSDMYAVGVMLYQLLTGRLPFQGRTMPQLIASALEQKPASPRRLRKEIPAGLARIILRCLEKQPSDRFRSYADLCRALAPYSSTAPTPATLGLRFLAGMLDMLVWNLVAQVGIFLAVGDPFSVMDHLVTRPAHMWPLMVLSFAAMLLYYGLTEWRWGATAGKAICRLRVVRPDGSYPSLGGAFLRAGCYVMLPVLPYWIFTFASGDPLALVGNSALNSIMSTTQFLVLGLMFSSARRRNGYASVYDLLTGTRIVARTLPEKRLGLTADPSVGQADATSERIGPYHVLRPLGVSGDAEWVEGFDLRLLRRVLIRRLPPGAPPCPAAGGQVTRPGRLRWLNSRRAADENWDAFEGVGGEALATLCEAPQPWGQVRFWLHDLASELAAAERDGTLPDRLAVDRIWITEEGRAKLSDVPLPGGSGTGSGEGPAAKAAADAPTLLDEVAAHALTGGASTPASAADVSLPLPVPARTFLQRLPGLPGPAAAAASLRPLLDRGARITRLRRVMAVALCMVVPIMGSLAVLVGGYFMQRWEREYPELMQMQRMLNFWQARQNPLIPGKHLPPEDVIGVYIATHFGDVIESEAWSGGFARVMISKKARAFAETSLVDYAGASPEDKKQAEEALKPLLQLQHLSANPPVPAFPVLIIAGAAAFYVGIPSILMALLFRGGLVLLATGTTFVRRDGRRASRLRLFWRALVTWSPPFAVLFVAAAAHASGAVLAPLLAGAVAFALVAISLLLPDRGLPDRLSGTWPVMR